MRMFQGDEWSVADVVEKYDDPQYDRWHILETSVHHLGSAAILAFPSAKQRKSRSRQEKVIAALPTLLLWT